LGVDNGFLESFWVVKWMVQIFREGEWEMGYGRNWGVDRKGEGENEERVDTSRREEE
jgi:hypothetical protein